MLTRDLAEVGLPRAFKVEYQRREARFALKTRGETLYFTARDFDVGGGTDWLGLRLAVLAAAAEARRGPSAQRGDAERPDGAHRLEDDADRPGDDAAAEGLDLTTREP